MRYQPQGVWRLAPLYRAIMAGGWLAQPGGYYSIGPASLTAMTRFEAIRSTGAMPGGGWALSANAGTDTGAAASLAIGSAPVRNNFTFAGVFRVRATQGAGVGARSNTNDILLWRNGTAYAIRINGATFTGPTLPLNTVLHYVLSSTPAGIYLCVNGVEILSAAASSSSVDTGVGVEVYEDSRGGGAMDLDAGLCVLLNTGLAREAARSLSANLWQMFAEPEEDDYVSAAQSYFLSAGVGSFSMSGAAVPLRATRRLGADVGQFTYLGANSRLLAQRRVAAMAGEFSVNLSTVRGIVSRRLTAGTGSLALVAPSASLRVARRLSAAPGALDIAGSAVGMIYTQADERQGYTLTAAAGSFGLTGADAALRAQRRLVAGSGAFSLLGAAARIALGRRLVGAVGGLTLQGNPAVLRAARRVPVGAGDFGLVGTDAQLRYSAQIDYAPAPAGPGYSPQQRYSESRPAATSAPRPPATQRNYR